MTIGSVTVQTSGSTGNGVTTAFSFSFHVDDYGDTEAEDQIEVIRETIATGAEEILVRTTDYTVTINGDQDASPGGSVTMLSAPSSSFKIWIRLDPDFTQQTDYQNQGGFLMETVEDQADQHTRQILALKDMTRRAPRVGIQAGTSFDGEMTGDLTAGYTFIVNQALTGYTLGAPSSVAVSSAMTPVVQAATLAAGQIAFGVREVLTANRTYYVRTDGSDSNTGLTDTAGGAFLTIQKAIDVIANRIDNNGFNVTITVAAGTYTGGVIVTGPWLGDGDVTLGMGASVIISTTDAHGVLVWWGGRLKLNCTGGGKIQTATTGGNNFHGIYTIYGGVIEATAVSFGACAGSKIQSSGEINLFGNHTSTGNAVSEWHFAGGRIHFNTGTYTLSGTPAYSAYFLGGSDQGNLNISNLTFSGSATGSQFTIHKGAICIADGKTSADIPGDVAGAIGTGGRFIGSANGPVSVAGATHTVAPETEDLIFTGSGCTVTLPTAASATGRVLHLRNTGSGAVISASSNVVPVIGGAAGTAILGATAGTFARLVCDGTSWIMQAGTTQLALLNAANTFAGDIDINKSSPTLFFTDPAANDFSIGGASNRLRFTQVSANSMLQMDSAAAYLQRPIVANVQSLSGAGAVDLTTATTAFTSTGVAQALTLANGVVGQIKHIVHVADGGSGVLTPTNLANGTTITFTNVGDSATLQFLGTEWFVEALQGAVLA